MSDTLNFGYSISKKEGLSVVMLQGRLSDAGIASLTKCGEELTVDKPKFVVVNIPSSFQIDRNVHREFTMFQKGVRDAGSGLRVCVESADTRALFTERGIVREDEMRKDLRTTLQEILVNLKTG